MLNIIWLALIVLALVLGGFNGTLETVTKGAFTAAEDAVMKIALPLTGVMAIWLGMMRLAEKAGLIQLLARGLRPLMTRLFPDVPPTHPAMGAMLLNMGANMLGLSNAATPLGLKAMEHLSRLNRNPGTASNAMCTFLAINTSSIQLLPVSAITLLAVNGATHPTSIVGSALLATTVSTIVGVASVKLLEKLPAFRLPPPETDLAGGEAAVEEAAETFPPASRWGMLAVWGLAGSALLFFLMTLFPNWFRQFPLLVQCFPPLLGSEPKAVTEPFFVFFMRQLSTFAIPFLLALLPLYAAARRVKVYEEFVEGAKEAFPTALRIIPYLVGMLVAIKMFRDSGGMGLIIEGLRPALAWLHFPPELLPLALMRPLSGSGSMALLAEMITNPAYGPNHLLSLTAATIYGSTETTFYVVAVYFGAVGIRRTRHAIPAGLLADAAGVIASIVICRMMFGGG